MRVAAAILIALGLMLWGLNAPAEPPGPSSAIAHQELERDATPERSDAKAGAVSDRSSLSTAPADSLVLTVVDASGAPLDAEVELPSGTVLTAAGVCGVGRGSGPIEVRRFGYVTVSIERVEKDTTVVLQQARSVRGTFYDQLTGTPVSEVDVTVRSQDGFERSARTDVSGSFELQVPTGTYRMNAVKHGYVDLCLLPSPTRAGIDVEVGSEDVSLRRALYPIYGAMVVLENESNLADEVLAGLFSWSSDMPGEDIVPGFMAPVHQRLATTLTERYGGLGLVTLRMLSSPESDRGSRMQAFCVGERIADATLSLRPLAELRDSAPTVIPIGYRWHLTALTIRAPVPLALSAGSMPYYGIPIEPGDTRLELPVGDYTVHARTASLLNARAWMKQISLPATPVVDMTDVGPFGTLRITAPAVWQRASCDIHGAESGVYLPEGSTYPDDLAAVPGEYQVMASDASRGARWKTTVVVREGEVSEVRLGGD